ncbi:MAG TPA: hypothetical protein VME66_10100 [Candidatus Acidoferrales bacterium]|nr:hypothetical protein [Candidatus Acidoferrales bacterium]
MSFPKALTGIVLVAALAACGSGGSHAASTAASAAASAGNAMANAGSQMAGAAGSMAGALASKVAAAIPVSLHCGAVPPVWVNPVSHVYHEPSDPLYGKTKKGAYMCTSAAVQAGYHRAGGRKSGKWRHKKGSAGEMAPTPAST